MNLTKAEFKELQELHNAIYIADCFGSRDLLRENELLGKCSDAQYEKIYGGTI